MNSRIGLPASLLMACVPQAKDDTAIPELEPPCYPDGKSPTPLTTDAAVAHVTAVEGILPVGDLDGDGASEVALRDLGEDTADTKTDAVMEAGGPLLGEISNGSSLTGAVVYLPVEGQRMFGYYMAGGMDVTGDAAPDLFLSADSTHASDAFVYTGTDFVMGAASPPVADIRVPYGKDGEWASVSGLGPASDLDGDGLNESFLTVVDPDTPATVYAFQGPLSGTLGLEDGYEVVRWDSYSYSMSPGSAAGDVNGDGYADLATAPWPQEDARAMVWTGAASLDAVFSADPYARLVGDTQLSTPVDIGGDFDGDGRADLVVSAGTQVFEPGRVLDYGGPTGGSGELRIYTGLGPGDRDVDDEWLSVAGSEQFDRFGGTFAVSDLDHDGLADLVAGWPGFWANDPKYGSEYQMDPSTSGLALFHDPAPGACRGISLAQATAIVSGPGGDVEFGAELFTFDNDGDGVEDVLATGPGGTEPEQAWVFDGRALLGM